MNTEVKEFASIHGLTPRETEVFLCLTLKIIQFKDIAIHLNLSPSTVNNHLKSVFEKTRTQSKSELLADFLQYIFNQLKQHRDRVSATPMHTYCSTCSRGDLWTSLQA
jgi:DNA-binding CsgD family transcriptional regulator